MKGKKKEKRYFCDFWKKVNTTPVLFLLILGVIVSIASLGSYIFTIWYANNQKENIALLDNYSDTLYDELEDAVVNHIKENKTIDIHAIQECADDYEISLDEKVTIIKCCKRNSDGFEARITVGISKDGKVLWTERQFKTSEEYKKEMKYLGMLIRNFHIWFIMAISIAFSMIIPMFIADSISKKHKKRDEAQKAKKKTGFEQ